MELNLQLNTKSAFNRDMTVELTNQATGQMVAVKPYLDGKVVARGLEAGPWRAVVKHPNILFPIYDRPIKVLPGRPTIVPIRIPENIFENTPIADTPDADLGPVSARYDEAAAAADAQGQKLAGQPIYADDWNAMAATIGDIARANLDLVSLVAPNGHDHPELVAKINEVQANLQRFYDLFGRSLTQLQRQVQQLALQRKVDAAVGQIGPITPAQRGTIDAVFTDLDNAWKDNPAVYSIKKKQAGQQLSLTIAEMVAGAANPIGNDPIVIEAQDVAMAMADEQAASDYATEIENQQRFEKRSGASPFTDALFGFAIRGGS